MRWICCLLGLPAFWVGPLPYCCWYVFVWHHFAYFVLSLTLLILAYFLLFVQITFLHLFSAFWIVLWSRYLCGWWIDFLKWLSIVLDGGRWWRRNYPFASKLFDSKCRVCFELCILSLMWTFLGIRYASLKASNNSFSLEVRWVSSSPNSFLPSQFATAFLLFRFFKVVLRFFLKRIIEFVLFRNLRHTDLLAIKSRITRCQKMERIDRLVFRLRKTLSYELNGLMSSAVKAFEALVMRLHSRGLITRQQNIGINVEKAWFEQLLERLITAWDRCCCVDRRETASKHFFSSNYALVWRRIFPFITWSSQIIFVYLNKVFSHRPWSTFWMRLWSWFRSRTWFPS